MQSMATYKLYIQLGEVSVILSLVPSMVAGGQAVLSEGNGRSCTGLVTPNPDTCRKPVLLICCSKGDLTCDLNDFLSLDWRVHAMYPCLLRSDSLIWGR